MKLFKTDDLGLSVTSMFVKMIGLWMAKNQFEQHVRNVTLFYTFFFVSFGFYVEATNLYHSWGDLSDTLFDICTLLSVIMPAIKIIILFINKEEFFRLIVYTERQFMNGDYNEDERKIVFDCKRLCTFFSCFLSSVTLSCVLSYVVTPIYMNIGRNESDRILPFKMWIDIPTSMTPYFEIFFTLQVLSAYQIGVSYGCFDNVLCIMNLHLATQFRILQHRLVNISGLKSKQTPKKDETSIIDSTEFADNSYDVFKRCVRQHQSLIAFCEKLEEVFSMIILGQLLVFSIFMCLDVCQVLLPGASVGKQMIFTFHLAACMCQLLMFTYSCDCIITESLNVTEAVYNGPWPRLPMSTSGRMIRKDLILVIIRSRVPCCLTARGFFVISLETYTKVISTAVSYFTLLRQRIEESNS